MTLTRNCLMQVQFINFIGVKFHFVWQSLSSRLIGTEPWLPSLETPVSIYSFLTTMAVVKSLWEADFINFPKLKSQKNKNTKKGTPKENKKPRQHTWCHNQKTDETRKDAAKGSDRKTHWTMVSLGRRDPVRVKYGRSALSHEFTQPCGWLLGLEMGLTPLLRELSKRQHWATVFFFFFLIL